MKFYIDTDECAKLNLPVSTALYLAALYYKECINRNTFEESLSRGLVNFSGYDKFYEPMKVTITQQGVDFVESIFLNSEFKPKEKEVDRFEGLATKLRELFPKGKKPGTSIMWRGSNYEIVKKLKTLIKKTGAEFTDEQAIEATKKYIESFNGNYAYMQVLPYFILKQVPVNGVYEEKSQLLSYIENAGQEDVDNNWTSELR
jgi:hypothetical protein